MKSAIRNIIAKKCNITAGEVSILHAGSGFVTYRTDHEKLTQLIRALMPIKDDSFDLIRFGSSGDGGYLIPDDLNGIEACFSPGVSGCSEFEKQCADCGIRVFMADKSVDGPAEKHELFHFTKKFVGAISDDAFVTMDDWVNNSISGASGDLLCQMDIEGHEYEVLLQMPECLINRFRILVIEFHRLDQLWNDMFFCLASTAFGKLLKNHRCVHIHPNNYLPVMKRDGLEIPPVMEFTFLRNDRFSGPSFASKFPHGLDSDCTSRPPLSLPACWYSRQDSDG